MKCSLDSLCRLLIYALIKPITTYQINLFIKASPCKKFPEQKFVIVNVHKMENEY